MTYTDTGELTSQSCWTIYLMANGTQWICWCLHRDENRAEAKPFDESICLRSMMQTGALTAWIVVQLTNRYAIEWRIAAVQHCGDEFLDVVAHHVTLFDWHDKCFIYAGGYLNISIAVDLSPTPTQPTFIPRQLHGFHIVTFVVLLGTRLVRLLPQPLIYSLHKPFAGRLWATHKTVTQPTVPRALRRLPFGTAGRLADVIRTTGANDVVVASCSAVQLSVANVAFDCGVDVIADRMLVAFALNTDALWWINHIG